MKNIIIGIFFLFQFNSYSQKMFFPDKVDYEKKTLVFFHPYLNNENFFKNFSNEFKNYNVIFFRGGQGEENIFSWYDIGYNEKNGSWILNKEYYNTVLNNINNDLKPFKNIWLVGYSQGGVIANGLLLLNPKKYSKIVSINSYFDTEIMKNIKLNKSSIYFIYGENDYIINPDLTKQSLNYLKDQGINLSILKHSDFHNISEKTYNKISHFIKQTNK